MSEVMSHETQETCPPGQEPPPASPCGAHGNAALVWRHLGACHGHPLTQDTAICGIPAEMSTYIHEKTCPVIHVAHTGN